MNTATITATADALDPSNHPLVSHARWIEQRKALLAREKELTRLGDAIARERRALPWVRLEMPAGIGVSGLESDGAGLFYCGGGSSGKIRAVRRPKRAAR